MTLLLKEKSCLVKRRNRDSSDDSFESDDNLNTDQVPKKGGKQQPQRYSFLSNSKVTASIPLYQTSKSNVAAPEGGEETAVKITRRVGGFMAKCKQLWDSCCYKHFPPI